MITAVLDGSALLALLNDESGAERVAEAVSQGAAMSAVNYGEVIGKLRDSEIAVDEVMAILAPLDIQVFAFTESHAARVGDLRPVTKMAGLSFGDRACLALAEEFRVPALTTDQAWARIAVSVPIHIIR